MPNYCHYCGIIGHTQRECEVCSQSELNSGSLPYGVWLRSGYSTVRLGVSGMKSTVFSPWPMKVLVNPAMVADSIVGVKEQLGIVMVTQLTSNCSPLQHATQGPKLAESKKIVVQPFSEVVQVGSIGSSNLGDKGVIAAESLAEGVVPQEGGSCRRWSVIMSFWLRKRIIWWIFRL